MKLPSRPPSVDDLLGAAISKRGPKGTIRLFAEHRDPAPGGRYRHWDKLLYLPAPEDVSNREWWLAIKMARQGLLKRLPLTDGGGRPFFVAVPDQAQAMLHDLDTRVGGAIASEGPITPQMRDTYVVRSLMEEAITSSQLEGASTTRRAAKEMLQAGRAPRNRNERMIANNYAAMRRIREIKNRALDDSIVMDLWRRVTDGTLDDESTSTRFRTRGDRIVVQDQDGQVLHNPPDAELLPQRLRVFYDFANARGGDGFFLHPIVKAILIHYWFAYEHPFADGNGRTARALFYWSLARDGYWLWEFVSISTILRKAPSKYARAFLYTQTDDNDVTYFLLHQLRVMVRAVDELYGYIERKERELKDVRRLLTEGGLRRALNHRQIALVEHAQTRPRFVYSIRTHQMTHGISYQTARTDLLDLASQGLLEMGKVGKRFVFDVPKDLGQRLGTIANAGSK